MIIDSLENAHKYTGVHHLFAKAFDYLSSINLDKIEVGKFEIDGDNLKAIVSSKKGMTTEESIAKFECHNHFIDIQICIKGEETFGWKTRAKCIEQKGDYNAEKDVLFYNDLPDTYFKLTDGQFVIFFPEDVHAPMIGTDEITKMVIKVKI
jgi:biofilm protein TabA